GIESDAWLAERLVDRGALHDGADRGAILRGHAVEPVGGDAGTGARHVLWHEAWIAGDVPRPMPRDRASIEIVAAADIEADHELDALAGVEILRAAGPACQKRDAPDESEASRVQTGQGHLSRSILL